MARRCTYQFFSLKNPLFNDDQQHQLPFAVQVGAIFCNQIPQRAAAAVSVMVCVSPSAVTPPCDIAAWRWLCAPPQALMAMIAVQVHHIVYDLDTKPSWDIAVQVSAALRHARLPQQLPG
jgi:hypothetical protein